MYIPNRGIFHRRDERGGAKAQVAGAHAPLFRCTYCGRRFATEKAVAQHERDRHGVRSEIQKANDAHEGERWTLMRK